MRAGQDNVNDDIVARCISIAFSPRSFAPLSFLLWKRISEFILLRVSPSTERRKKENLQVGAPENEQILGTAGKHFLRQ